MTITFLIKSSLSHSMLRQMAHRKKVVFTSFAHVRVPDRLPADPCPCGRGHDLTPCCGRGPSQIHDGDGLDGQARDRRRNGDGHLYARAQKRRALHDVYLRFSKGSKNTNWFNLGPWIISLHLKMDHY